MAHGKFAESIPRWLGPGTTLDEQVKDEGRIQVFFEISGMLFSSFHGQWKTTWVWHEYEYSNAVVFLEGGEPSRERIEFSNLTSLYVRKRNGPDQPIVIPPPPCSTVLSFFSHSPCKNSRRYCFITNPDMGRWTQYDEVRWLSFAILPKYPTPWCTRMITACQRAWSVLDMTPTPGDTILETRMGACGKVLKE